MSSTPTRRRVDSGTRLSSLAGHYPCTQFIFDIVLGQNIFAVGPSEVCYFVRCDDNAKVKEKMIYASSKDELKKRLVGIATEVQANDKSGFDMKEVVDRVVKV